jgi:hypothetical protein
MSDPVTISVPLQGYDEEARAINAAVHLLEVTNFNMMFPGERLKPEQKERIANYLAARYSLTGEASR